MGELLACLYRLTIIASASDRSVALVFHSNREGYPGWGITSIKSCIPGLLVGGNVAMWYLDARFIHVV